MNPHQQFCPNIDCPARGQIGKGNIGIHSQKKKRFVCRVCQRTFTTSKATLFYRLHKDPQVVLLVLALLVYGCPVQGIVRAMQIDERTVRKWWQRAGQQCEKLHGHLVGNSQFDLQQVQADEIKVKTQRGWLWMALAVMVPTRLWLGGAVSPHRDQDLARCLADQVRRTALCRPLLLAVDGWWAYLGAFRRAFRSPLPLPPGAGRRPSFFSWPEVAIVQVIKRHTEDVWEIERRVVQGCVPKIEALLTSSQGGGMINTAYIERLNATFRQRLDSLTRRTRTLARMPETLTAGMWVLGCVYNFCDFHRSLRVKLWVGKRGYRWVQRTPALACGLTDHRWTLAEIMSFKVPLPRWKLGLKRGRPNKELQKLMDRWCL
jgi:transposase-like protein